jgi:hypothetical protein
MSAWVKWKIMEETIISQQLLDETYSTRRRTAERMVRSGRNCYIKDDILWKKKQYAGYYVDKSLYLSCQGCRIELKAGEKVNRWKIAAQYVYCHSSCMDLLKKTNPRCYRYSKAEGTWKERKGLKTSHGVNSSLDERDKHLYDKPTKL